MAHRAQQLRGNAGHHRVGRALAAAETEVVALQRAGGGAAPQFVQRPLPRLRKPPQALGLLAAGAEKHHVVFVHDGDGAVGEEGIGPRRRQKRLARQFDDDIAGGLLAIAHGAAHHHARVRPHHDALHRRVQGHAVRLFHALEERVFGIVVAVCKQGRRLAGGDDLPVGYAQYVYRGALADAHAGKVEHARGVVARRPRLAAQKAAHGVVPGKLPGGDFAGVKEVVQPAGDGLQPGERLLAQAALHRGCTQGVQKPARHRDDEQAQKQRAAKQAKEKAVPQAQALPHLPSGPTCPSTV